jgi:aspartate dehydrogenase
MQDSRELKVAIGGFGAIGKKLAIALDKGVEGLSLVAVSARNKERAQKELEGYASAVQVVDLGDLAELADIVVECCPAAHFADVAGPAVEQGRIFVPISVGALLDHMQLIDRARETGARIIAPTGALLGLDAVRAAAEGNISDIRIVTNKPPGGLVGAPHIVANNIDLDAIAEPTLVFSGSARDAIKGFPANVNVAVALSLAGIGPDKTMIEIWADPTVTRNTHRIVCDSDSAKFEMKIENIPSPENPRTGLITALSVLACLRGLVSPLRVGT